MGPPSPQPRRRKRRRDSFPHSTGRRTSERRNFGGWKWIECGDGSSNGRTGSHLSTFCSLHLSFSILLTCSSTSLLFCLSVLLIERLNGRAGVTYTSCVNVSLVVAWFRTHSCWIDSPDCMEFLLLSTGMCSPSPLFYYQQGCARSIFNCSSPEMFVAFVIRSLMTSLASWILLSCFCGWGFTPTRPIFKFLLCWRLASVWNLV